ncbi:MAG: hypothetical protein HYY17_04285 [Planctomycetes bacterium]|nr:hypothetical protein [Planctomycetota bacterium]
MAGKSLDISFAYGNLVSVTPGTGGSYVLWFTDSSGIVRGLSLDVSDPANPKLLPEREITIRRRTEGQMKRKRGSLPPISAAPEKK